MDPEEARWVKWPIGRPSGPLNGTEFYLIKLALGPYSQHFIFFITYE
jgi:hypothetical protein